MASHDKVIQRLAALHHGETVLRQHLREDAAIRLSLVYDSMENSWIVRVTAFPDNHSPITIREPLEQFPSEFLIAQLMLVA